MLYGFLPLVESGKKILEERIRVFRGHAGVYVYAVIDPAQIFEKPVRIGSLLQVKSDKTAYHHSVQRPRWISLGYVEGYCSDILLLPEGRRLQGSEVRESIIIALPIKLHEPENAVLARVLAGKETAPRHGRNLRYGGFHFQKGSLLAEFRKFGHQTAFHIVR